MAMSLDEKICLFFTDPHIEPESMPTIPGFPHRKHLSTLYLLHRDMFACMRVSTPYLILFPGVFCILTGIDLLSKFNSSDRMQLQDRFREYLGAYCGFDQHAADAMYHFRNALMHSYGFYNNSGNDFYLVGTAKEAITYQGVNESGVRQYTIAGLPLLQLFEESLLKYQDILRGDSTKQDIFERMFDRYGSIIMGG